jgi:hypothetical protein
MHLSPELTPPYPPALSPSQLSDTERSLGEAITSNLSTIRSKNMSVGAAVALYELARSNSLKGLYFDWALMAGRDGALSLYDYGQALAKVRSLIGRVSSWFHRIDRNRLKQAEKEFDAAFPFSAQLRHSVAHPELYNNPEKRMGIGIQSDMDNADSEDGLMTINGSIINHSFSATFEGTLVQYALTSDTVRSLTQITQSAFEAFNVVSPFPLYYPGRS